MLFDPMWQVGPLGVVPVLGAPALAAFLPWLIGALVALSKPSTLWKLARILWRVKVSLVVLAVLIVGGIFGARYLRGSDVVGAVEETKTWWPMFRGGAARAGAVGGSLPPLQGGQIWQFKEETTFYSTPTVVGNRVYATSVDYGPLSDKGVIFCLDADTGGVDWQIRPKGYRATFSSPSVFEKYLVVGEGLHFTRDARVFCLDITQKGKVLWEYRTNSHVESSPCIADGRVYVGAGDDGYYCFELEPDSSGNARVVWHTPPEQFLDAETCPAYADGRVFVGLGMGGKAVCALDAKTGKELWRQAAPYPVFTPPTVVGGKVFVGMGNGNFIEEAEAVMAKELEKLRAAGKSKEEIDEARKNLGPAGEVWCLDAATGKVEWKQKLGRTILGAIAAAKDRLFFGCRDGWLYSFSLDGQPRGKWNANAPIVTSPAVTERHVHIVTETGRLYGINTDTMDLEWETPVGTEQPYLSSPTIARGHVYVGSHADGLLCFGTPRLEVRKPIWAGDLGGVGVCGSLEELPLPGEYGSLGWRWPAGGAAATQPAAVIAAPPAALGEHLCVPVAQGQRLGVACLRNDPKVRSSRDVQELWFCATDNGVKLSPAIAEDAVYIVDGKEGDAGRYLRCVNRADGAVRWRTPVAPGASGQFGVLRDLVVVQDGERSLTALGTDGAVKWTKPVGKMCQSAAAKGSMILAALEAPSPALVALDRDTGTLLWTAPLEGAPKTGPVVRKNLMYVGTADGIVAASVIDGSVAWQSKSGGVERAFALLVNPDRILYIDSAGHLVAVDTSDGSSQRLASGAVAGFPPLVGRGEVLFLGWDESSGPKTIEVMRYVMAAPKAPGTRPATTQAATTRAAPAAQAQRWMKLSDWPWTVQTPMVLLDGRVVFGTDRGGLVCLVKRRTGG
jgi:outer membrane protein assembly factor BamB